MRFRFLLLVATLSALAALHPSRAEVIRYPIPNSTFPIAQAVEVKGNVSTFYVSGQVPPVVDTAFDTNAREAYGDTKTQTVGVLNRVKTILEGFGLGMGDVVKMQVFLVHTPASPMDFKAFMDGYTQFFGGTQPNLPPRSVVGVASLANPGFLVEIEVIAVKNAQGPQ
jgi:enamine deaminase RidA (YjgF/YER057c/UK114 family)